jgi:hypothetical protein
MAKVRAARADDLGAQAWAAGCRDVQAAINWAAARGEAAGRPFLTAFRQVMTAQPDARPPVPPAATPSADPGPALAGGRGKRNRRGGLTRPEPDRPAEGRPDERSARAKPEGNGQVGGEPAPGRGASTAAGPNPGTPAEFVEDMRQLRHLVTKYGKKGLADLINLFGG